jgi:hypothetical protein
MSVSLDRISSPTPSGLTAHEKQVDERRAVLYLIAVLMLFAAATAASLPRPVASPPETLRSLRAEVQP